MSETTMPTCGMADCANPGCLPDTPAEQRDNANAELNEKDLEIEVLRGHISRLDTQVTELRTNSVRATRELEEFKEKVVRVAMEAAQEHDWCSVVHDLLTDELGLAVSERTFSIDVTVEYQITGTIPWGAKVSERDLRYAVDVGNLEFDHSDVTDCDMRDPDVSITVDIED